MSTLGERIKRARSAAGLSQRDVAERAALSAMAVSKFERGETTPTSATLIRLARALGTRTEFFFRPEAVALERPEYRKKASLGAKQQARIEADILEQVERFIELVDLFPARPIARFSVPETVSPSIASMASIESVAVAVRDAWRLGHNAVPRLAETLEEHGLLVLSTRVETSAKFDGLAATVGGLPLVVVGAGWPGDRQRFTMAHELGHLVLEGRLAEGLDEEKACNRFAGAFLVPGETVVSELGERRSWLEPRELHALKHAYGMSMAAWVYRAYDAGVVSDATKTSLFRMFSSEGWRTLEPWAPVPAETPQLFERLVLRALAEDMISSSKAAELMGMSRDDFERHHHAGEQGAHAYR